MGGCDYIYYKAGHHVMCHIKIIEMSHLLTSAIHCVECDIMGVSAAVKELCLQYEVIESFLRRDISPNQFFKSKIERDL